MILSSWSNWAENCTQVYVAKSVSLSIAPSVRVLTWSSRYPESVPSGTAIPNWAFLDVTAAETFNAIAAEADGGKSFKHTNSSCLKVGCRYTWVDRVVYNTYWYYLRFCNTYGCTLAPARIKAIQVLFQVVWSEVWSVWHSLPGPLSSSCVAAKPKLRSRLLMVLMIKVHPVKLFWTLLPSCNNFLNLLTTKRRITAPTNMLVTTPNHSTTLMIPAFGPKILGSTQLIFTQQLLVRDNSPTAHLSPGITMVFLSCGVDVMCMLVGSNYVTHLLTLWFHVAICTVYPTIKNIADLATREFTCRTSILLAKFGRYFRQSSSTFFENLI